MNYLFSALTDIGNTKNTNQDSFAARIYNINGEKLFFSVLCDGMGGLSKGEVASSTVVKAFCNWADNRLPVLYSQGLTDNSITNEWTEIIKEYNDKIKLYGKKCGISIGTTATVLMLASKKCYILNIGDTRAYELYDTVRIITRDHTVVAREVELGHITSQQAEKDPRRSVLLQCIGASDSVYPDVFIEDAKSNSVYMLCTDGFRHEVKSEEIYALLNPSVSTKNDIIRTNIEKLISINKERHERDNITCIAVRTY